MISRDVFEILVLCGVIDDLFGELARTQEARRFLLHLLRARFGDLPETVVARVESESAEWCRTTAERLLRVRSLRALGLTTNGS